MVVRRFKERGAEYYRETRKTILNEMVKGNVIHADETRIRLHDKTGYVWVFTTLREVVYFYSDTREGSMATIRVRARFGARIQAGLRRRTRPTRRAGTGTRT